MPVKSPFDLPNLQFELQKLAFIALGSNLGNPKQQVLRALDRLQDFSQLPTVRSSLWQTSPVDCPADSPPFVNAVAGLLPRANETAESLLDKLQTLEQEFGRPAKRALNEPLRGDPCVVGFLASSPIASQASDVTWASRSLSGPGRPRRVVG